jgi:hypothetical protein
VIKIQLPEGLSERDYTALVIGGRGYSARPHRLGDKRRYLWRFEDREVEISVSEADEMILPDGEELLAQEIQAALVARDMPTRREGTAEAVYAAAAEVDGRHFDSLGRLELDALLLVLLHEFKVIGHDGVIRLNEITRLKRRPGVVR